MQNSQIAAQLYTLRDFLQTPEDIAKTLKKVKEIGYDAVQLSGLCRIDPLQLKGYLDEAGLTVCATHISYEQMCSDMDSVLNDHRLWNCKHVGIGGMPVSYRSGREGFAAFAKEASRVARILAENGHRFIYHNHHFEFERFNGLTGLDILFNESDPEVFDFEIDTYWVQAGGGDPAAWIRKMKNRMSVIHFKDMTITGDTKQTMAEIGEGNLNWAEIVKACNETGIEWYAVEQDICQRSPFESLSISLKNMRKMGLI